MRDVKPLAFEGTLHPDAPFAEPTGIWVIDLINTHWPLGPADTLSFVTCYVALFVVFHWFGGLDRQKGQ